MNIFENAHLINYDEILVESFKNNITWKYKKPLSDTKIFDDIEKEYDITVPNYLRTFITNYNAASPSKYRFKNGSNECVFGGVISYNRNDDDDIIGVIKSINNKSIIPFAVDPYGNYICISISDNKVVFWDHETDNIHNLNKNLDDFINSLY